jgi:DNA repair protein RecO (recombination protein O)
MKLESVGILIALRPFDEKNAIAQIFTREYGVMSGMLRGAVVARTNRPLVGQVGSVSWNARLDSALGVFHWDAEKNLSAPIMMRPDLLPFMNARFDLICTMLPERESYEHLYDDTIKLLTNLVNTNTPADEYLGWEITLLGELGYALDLTHCSGCGGTENLCYLSPKTGRAVCDKCAAPYINKLYKLPVTLNTTLRFLENICMTVGTKLPQFRVMLGKIKI